MVEADEINPGLNPADPFLDHEMINLEGLDIEMELASFIGEDNGWDAGNILDNIGSPESLSHADFHQPNPITEEQQQKDLDSSTFKTSPTNENMEPILEQAADLICDPNLNGSINATQNQVQTTIEPPAYNNSENPLLPPTPTVHVPNTTLNQITLPTHSSPSPVGLISEIAGSSSIQDQDMAHTGCFCQFAHMQNDNSNIDGVVLGMPNQQSINNHSPVVMPNIIMGSNNFISGINHLHHPTPYPALCYIYPIIQGGGGIGTGQSSGQFIPNQRDAALQNNITPHTPHRWPGSNQFPSPNVYYAPNNMQQHESSYRQANPFTPLLHQDSHGFGMQKIYDLQSQNYFQAAYPAYPNKPQQQAHLHSVFQVAPNNDNSHHQHGGCNNSRRPNNAFVVVPPSPNPHAHQHPYNTRRTFLPDPPMYPMRYDNHFNNPQAATMPGGRWQQGVGSSQLKVSQQGVPVAQRERDYYRSLLNTQNNNNVERQRHRLQKPALVPQAVLWSSRNLQAGGGTTRTPIPDEGSSSQGSNSSPPHHYARLTSLLRPEKESGGVQKQNNVVTNRLDKGKGKFPDYSSPSGETSEAIRRILDMTPTRTVTRNPTLQHPDNNLSSGRVLLQSGPPPEAAHETHLQNEVQSANPTGRPSPPSVLSELSNGIYDVAYAKIGLPIDPFLRSQAINAREVKGVEEVPAIKHI